MELLPSELRRDLIAQQITHNGIGLLFGKTRRPRSLIIQPDHMLTNINPTDRAHPPAQSFGDGARAAGVVEEADVAGIVVFCVIIVGGAGKPRHPEPGFALL